MLKNTIKKIKIAVFAVIFCVGTTGCENNKAGNKELETLNQADASTQEPEKNIIKKKELSEELYGTIKGGVYTATQGALQLNVPDSWRVSEEDATIIVAGAKEDTKDCVSIHVAERDEQFKSYTQEDFEKNYNKLFDNLKFEEFKHTKVGNMDAIYIRYSCSKDSMDIVEYQYLLNGENTYLISFTDVSGELEKEIESCMDSVIICR